MCIGCGYKTMPVWRDPPQESKETQNKQENLKEKSQQASKEKTQKPK